MPTPSIVYSPKDGRFRYATSGRLVSAVQVRAELDRSLQATAQRIKLLGDDLRAGRVSLDSWRFQMRQAVKEVHLRSSALAKGGWDRMAFSDFGSTGAVIKQEYKHLEQWVEEIKTGLPLGASLTTRGQLYAAAGRSTFQAVQAEEMQRRGMDLARSVKHAADHCQQCVDEEDAGWRPVSEIVPIGERTCGRNCRCSLEFKRAEAA